MRRVLPRRTFSPSCSRQRRDVIVRVRRLEDVVARGEGRARAARVHRRESGGGSTVAAAVARHPRRAQARGGVAFSIVAGPVLARLDVQRARVRDKQRRSVATDARRGVWTGRFHFLRRRFHDNAGHGRRRYIQAKVREETQRAGGARTRTRTESRGDDATARGDERTARAARTTPWYGVQSTRGVLSRPAGVHAGYNGR